MRSARSVADTLTSTSLQSEDRLSRGTFLSALAAVAVTGFLLRIGTAGQSLFGDELATYWVVSSHSLPGVLRTVHSDAEITPPLLFLLAKLSLLVDSTPQGIRIPSLIAGSATIPVVGLIGERVRGREAGIFAAALVALSPFMLYYSVEARGYALMTALVAASSLALLHATEDACIRRWWVIYAAATCGALYSHYTAIFVLAGQVFWLTLYRRTSIKPALVASGVAVISFIVPWGTGFYADLTSPTGDILAALSPFTVSAVVTNVKHWALGNPYAIVPLSAVPGDFAVVLILTAVGTSLLYCLINGSRTRKMPSPQSAFILVLALATPIGVAAQSVLLTSIFSMRNISASWPGLALLVTLCVFSSPPKIRLFAAPVVIMSMCISATTSLASSAQRPKYEKAARYVSSIAQTGGVVIDGTAAINPGPLSGLDPYFAGSGVHLLRAGAPAERTRPFTYFDPIVTLRDSIRTGARLADGRRIVVVGTTFPGVAGYAQRRLALAAGRPPQGYRQVAHRSWGSRLGTVDVRVLDYVPLENRAR